MSQTAFKSTRDYKFLQTSAQCRQSVLFHLEDDRGNNSPLFSPVGTSNQGGLIPDRFTWP